MGLEDGQAPCRLPQQWSHDEPRRSLAELLGTECPETSHWPWWELTMQTDSHRKFHHMAIRFHHWRPVLQPGPLGRTMKLQNSQNQRLQGAYTFCDYDTRSTNQWAEALEGTLGDTAAPHPSDFLHFSSNEGPLHAVPPSCLGILSCFTDANIIPWRELVIVFLGNVFFSLQSLLLQVVFPVCFDLTSCYKYPPPNTLPFLSPPVGLPLSSPSGTSLLKA